MPSFTIGQPIVATLSHFEDDAVGDLEFRLVDLETGDPAVDWDDADIEQTTESGEGPPWVYEASRATDALPAGVDRYQAQWRTASAGPWIDDDEITLVTAPHGTYTTPGALRLELNMDEDDTDTLSDVAATKLILDAEDAVDAMLGVGYLWVDEDTGRKVVEADVEGWQWSKLDRATAKMAAALYRDPTMMSGQRYNKITGPDFSREGPLGAQAGSQITALLDDSRLRRLTSRAGNGGPRMRDGYVRFLAATRHNGT